MYGQLVPVGGGDTIPLMKKKLLVGRRESCDVTLRFPNVSTHHCELHVIDGYWYVQDLNSRNGTKVNKVRVEAGERRIDPGDMVAFARHKYTLQYSPVDLGAVGPPPDDRAAAIFGRGLLERAGLKGRNDRDEPGDEPSASNGSGRLSADAKLGDIRGKKRLYDR